MDKVYIVHTYLHHSTGGPGTRSVSSYIIMFVLSILLSSSMAGVGMGAMAGPARERPDPGPATTLSHEDEGAAGPRSFGDYAASYYDPFNGMGNIASSAGLTALNSALKLVNLGHETLPDDNTSLLLDFMDAGSTYFYDISSNRNDGSPQGSPTIIGGPYTYAASFPTSGDQIRVATNETLNFTTVMSIEFWLRLHQPFGPGAASSTIILAKGDPFVALGGYAVVMSAQDGTIMFMRSDGTGSSTGPDCPTGWDCVRTARTSWVANAWYHVAFTWDGLQGSPSAKSYVNGSYDNTSLSSQLIQTNSMDLCINGNVTGSNTTLMDIDGLRLSDIVRSGPDISAAARVGAKNGYAEVHLTAPPGKGWDRLRWAHLEYPGTSVTLGVFDQNFVPITGLTGLKQEDVDLSKLDIKANPAYAKLIFRFTLTGDGFRTPLVDDLAVSWKAPETWADSFVDGHYTPIPWEVRDSMNNLTLEGDPYNFSKTSAGSGNILLAPGTSGQWDATYVRAGSMIDKGTGYSFYYTGSNTWPAAGLATSNSPTGGFTRSPSNPVLEKGETGSWDEFYDSGLEPLLLNGTYIGAFEGSGASPGLGIALSGNGTSFYKLRDEPFIGDFGGGAWDDGFVSNANMIYSNGKYYLFYQGEPDGGSSGKNYEIGLTTSDDLIGWYKSSNSRILTKGFGGPWSDAAVGDPGVMQHKGRYLMYYTGSNSTGTTDHIGVAVSNDLTTWTKGRDSFIPISKSGEWDEGQTSDPTVIYDDTTGLFFMYYTGYPTNLATSSVGVLRSARFMNATVVTNPISLPLQRSWGNVTVAAYKPAGTNISLSLMNGTNDAVVPGYDSIVIQGNAVLNISNVSRLNYPSLRLKVRLSGDGIGTPSLAGLAVTFSKEWLQQTGPIPNVTMLEDGTLDKGTDLALYFDSSNVPSMNLNFTLSGTYDPMQLDILLDWHFLDYQGGPDWNGLVPVKVTAEDPYTHMKVVSNVFYVNVTPVNDPPRWAGLMDEDMYQGEVNTCLKNLSAVVTDVDSNATNLTFTYSMPPEHEAYVHMNLTPVPGRLPCLDVAIEKGAPLVVVPVALGASDVSASSTAKFNISILENVTNHSPEITSVPPTVGFVGEDYYYDVNATDADGDAVTYGLGAAPSGMSIDPYTGMVDWTPFRGGDYNVEVTASDGSLTTRQSFLVFVSTPSNHPPVFESRPPTTVDYRDVYVYEPVITDEDGDTVYLELVQGAVGMYIQYFNNSLVWYPSEWDIGFYDIILLAYDMSSETYQNYTLEVTRVNQPPVMNDIVDRNVKANSELSLYISAYDPDNDPLIFELLSGPNGMAIAADGLLTWTPTDADVGKTFDVEVAVTDGEYSSSRTFRLTVDPGDVTPPDDDGGNDEVPINWTVLAAIILFWFLALLVLLYVYLNRGGKHSAGSRGTSGAPPQAVHRPAPGTAMERGPATFAPRPYGYQGTSHTGHHPGLRPQPRPKPKATTVPTPVAPTQPFVEEVEFVELDMDEGPAGGEDGSTGTEVTDDGDGKALEPEGEGEDEGLGHKDAGGPDAGTDAGPDVGTEDGKGTGQEKPVDVEKGKGTGPAPGKASYEGSGRIESKDKKNLDDILKRLNL